MPRLRTFRRPSQSLRRQTSWAHGPGSSAALQTPITGTTTALVGTGVLTTVDGATLIRTRGMFTAFLSSAVSALDSFVGAIGICKVTSSAFNTGVAAVPTPVTDISWDGWIYHQFFQLIAAGPIDNGVSADTDGITGHTAKIILEIDSKAMRKFNTQEVIVGVLEGTELGAINLNWFFDTRMLFKIA